jgi:hypothetical protein
VGCAGTARENTGYSSCRDTPAENAYTNDSTRWETSQTHLAIRDIAAQDPPALGGVQWLGIMRAPCARTAIRYFDIGALPYPLVWQHSRHHVTSDGLGAAEFIGIHILSLFFDFPEPAFEHELRCHAPEL